MPEDATPLWKLSALHDRSLVIAFVYELDPQQNEPKPLTPADDAEAEALKEVEEAAKDLSFEALGQGSEPCPPPDSVMDGPDFGGMCVQVPWGFKMAGDSVLSGGKPEDALQGEVGDTCVAKTGPARVLVALTLTACRERSDYEPAGVVGMARLYPHIMVKANIPLKKIEGSIRFDRPTETTTRGEVTEAGKRGCCRTYDGTDGIISASVFTDANSNDSGVLSLLPPLPFWSTFFSYYQVDAFQVFGSERMKMVRTDRPDARQNAEGLVERDVVGGIFTQTAVKKVPKQGEFDNVHLAPKLTLLNVQAVRMKDPSPGTIPIGIAPPLADLPITNRAALRLDDITMAPFCAHDCFHMHWRWGAHADSKWVRGWDATGPYKVAGAPLVPLNQNVDVWLRSPSSMTYHAVAGSDDEGSLLPSGEWQVLMYHGASYAVAITGALSLYLAQLGFNVLAAPVELIANTGVPLSCHDSTALFYWWARFKPQVTTGVVTPVERVTIYNIRGCRYV